MPPRAQRGTARALTARLPGRDICTPNRPGPSASTFRWNSCSTVDDRPAVRVEHLSGHIARILAREEQEGRRDFVGLSGAAHRGVLSEMLQLFGSGAAARIEWSPDRPRRDGVHADALPDQILRKAAGESGDRALGRTVVEQFL